MYSSGISRPKQHQPDTLLHMSEQRVRQDMVNNAVSFLTDPSVNDTPLAKKIQFLESKGMTNAEIQHALSMAQQQPVTSTAAIPPPPTQSPAQLPPPPSINPYPYYVPPPPPAPRSYDWKDYVIMSTTAAGFLYGAYTVVSRYVLPKVIPPTQSKLDEDKDAMEREFQRVEGILQKLETDQTEFIKRQDEKSKLIDDALIEVDAIVKATNEKNLRNEETLKYLKLEIDSIKTTLLKNLESQKSTISSELKELEKKTDSLKQSVENFQLNANLVAPSTTTGTSSFSTAPTPAPSPTPPPNLLTNNRPTSNVAASTVPGVSKDSSTFSNLVIPSPSDVPSVKDILGSDYKRPSTSTTSTAASVSEGVNNSKGDNIPAWQLAASQKTNINNDQNGSIPAWQLAAQDN